MEVYAYYSRTDKGLKKQSLKDHIEESLKAFENEIKDTKVWRCYVNSCEHDERIVEKWMKFAITFHDIGKMFYQGNFRHYNGKTYLNFTGHEFFSTFLADKFLSIWLKNDVENRISEYRDFRWIVCASILYHHHAMGLRGRERLGEVKVCKENEFDELIEKAAKLCKKSLDGLSESQVISEFLEELKLVKLVEKKGSSTLIIDPNSIFGVVRYVEDLNTRIWEEFAKSGDHNRNFRKRMLLATNILILSDYKGARGRSTKRTKFGEVLSSFLKLYRAIV